MNRRPVLPMLAILMAVGLAGCASNQNLPPTNGTTWQPPHNSSTELS